MTVKNYLCCLLVLLSFQLTAQKKASTPMSEATFKGLKLRNVGPAFTSGRIADIAIHPNDDNVWYVAVGSGGVWKTENAGTTWKPIFDDQPVYSTGCITLDPQNPHTVWLGTGENVGGRHVGFGDGIYKSPDGGKTWKNMGLKKSEHISKIIVHPKNSDVLWVAVQGPLWNKGDERGLYKTTDGGKTWKKTLGDAEWTGVTDIMIDPRNPDWLYAATWQRHRTVAAYLGGGPNSGIHRSTDGGETWEELKTGLPQGNMGKIGLAISPQQPDILYAAIELNRTKGAVYRSTNRGASWEKRSDAVSGATGPHYYQELYACPHHFDRIYLMDVRIQISDDGGKNFRRLNESLKHSDNHAVAFRVDDPDYLLIGSDGGLYESFDGAQNWRFFNNMPITQYYKVAVDDAEPFYNIFGGTQDNGSHGGPSRTDNRHGIRNADWYKTLGADGHQSAVEPGNPNIGYAETQRGGMHRIDRITGEQVFIQPQAGKGEGFERFNWDAPIIASPHDPKTLYFASYRVWKSTDRGDSWTAISGDLTRGQSDRARLPIMGKTQASWDNSWDLGAMSDYSTITSLAESPVQKGVVYAGTDDGILQVSANAGQTWKKIEVGSIPGVPSTAFVNDVKADLYDANTVYVALDNHKYGDYKPYLVKSTDMGKSWKSITGNLKDKHLIWRMVQDHEQPNLLFAATEFGIYFTVDGGQKWVKLNGSPTISFRDLVIQRRENDLVGASFGRSFFVLDDYSPLREISESKLEETAILFQPKKTYHYVPKSIISSYGAQEYIAPNPDFGATFTYYLKDGLGKKDGEKGKMAKKEDFPSWEALDAKQRADKPEIWLTVKDADGQVVRQIKGKSSKGMHRITWDLKHASKNIVPLKQQKNRYNRWGFMAVLGTYSVTLSQKVEGVITQLAEPKTFEVVPLRKGALPNQSPEAIAQFRQEMETVITEISATSATLAKSMDKVKAMEKAIYSASGDVAQLSKDIYDTKMALNELDLAMNGNKAKQEIGERDVPTIRNRMFVGYRGLMTSYGPTPTHRATIKTAKEELETLKVELLDIVDNKIPQLESALSNVGAPMLEGQAIPRGK
ncbi:MAG: glycosyl hydrolase [Bacteroidota bacterium]